MWNLRCLVVLASGPHNHIGRRRSGLHGLVVCIISLECSLCETKDSACNPRHVATCIGSQCAQKALASFLGKVGLFQYTLGRVDIWQVHRRGRVARVKNSCQAHTWLQGFDHASVNFVINNMSHLLVINRVNDLVKAIVFVAVEILGLTTVA